MRGGIGHLKVLFVLVPLFVVLLFPTASTSLAWDCLTGVKDTKENQKKGLCVEAGTPLPTPPPKHKPTEVKPTWTPVPETPVSQPTPSAPTATSVPTPPTSALPLSTPLDAGPQPLSPSPSLTLPSTTPSGGPRLAAYCLYQPTTQQYETRLTTDALKAINANLDTAHPAYVMPPEGVCIQPRTATPVSTTTVPTLTSVPPQPTSALPSSTPQGIGVQPLPTSPAPTLPATTPSIPTPTPAPTETPEITVSDDMPPVQIP